MELKILSRSEINHLTTLLLSRTVDNSVGTERVRSEPKTSDLQAFDGGQEKLSTHPAQENGIDHAVTGAISTPAIRSKVGLNCYLSYCYFSFDEVSVFQRNQIYF